MVQWLGLRASMQGARVRSLVGELRSCKSHGATKRQQRQQQGFSLSIGVAVLVGDNPGSSVQKALQESEASMGRKTQELIEKLNTDNFEPLDSTTSAIPPTSGLSLFRLGLYFLQTRLLTHINPKSL